LLMSTHKLKLLAKVFCGTSLAATICCVSALGIIKLGSWLQKHEANISQNAKDGGIASALGITALVALKREERKVEDRCPVPSHAPIKAELITPEISPAPAIDRWDLYLLRDAFLGCSNNRRKDIYLSVIADALRQTIDDQIGRISTTDRYRALTLLNEEGLLSFSQNQRALEWADSLEPVRTAPCERCRNYYGKEHGGQQLICAIHAYGPEHEVCPDWEAEP